MTKTKKWSNKYKKNINCKKPKGFSQKQYCKYGRKKTMKGGGRGDTELKVIKIGSERYEYKVVDMDKIIVSNKKNINKNEFRKHENEFRKHENEFRKQLPENIKHLNIEIKLTDKKTSKQPPVIDKHKPEDFVIPPSFSKRRQPTFNDIINELEKKERMEKENKIGYSRLSTLPKQSNKSKTPDKSNKSNKSNKSDKSNTSDKSNKSDKSKTPDKSNEFKKKQISETSSFTELGDSSSSK